MKNLSTGDLFAFIALLGTLDLYYLLDEDWRFILGMMVILVVLMALLGLVMFSFVLDLQQWFKELNDREDSAS